LLRPDPLRAYPAWRGVFFAPINYKEMFADETARTRTADARIHAGFFWTEAMRTSEN